MGWSALWGSVSSMLTTHLNSQFDADINSDHSIDNKNNNENNSDNENSNFVKESYTKCNTPFKEKQQCNKSFQTIIRPIADKIANQIISNILKSHGLTIKYKKLILNKKEYVIYLKALSTCIQICTLFSAAYVQVPRTILYNAQKSHNNGINKISKKSEIIWKLWMSHYELEERVEGLNGYTGGAGRLGLIVPYKREMSILRKDNDYQS